MERAVTVQLCDDMDSIIEEVLPRFIHLFPRAQAIAIIPALSMVPDALR